MVPHSLATAGPTGTQTRGSLVTIILQAQAEKGSRGGGSSHRTVVPVRAHVRARVCVCVTVRVPAFRLCEPSGGSTTPRYISSWATASNEPASAMGSFGGRQCPLFKKHRTLRERGRGKSSLCSKALRGLGGVMRG